jgi:hypothetical protein
MPADALLQGNRGELRVLKDVLRTGAASNFVLRFLKFLVGPGERELFQMEAVSSA